MLQLIFVHSLVTFCMNHCLHLVHICTRLISPPRYDAVGRRVMDVAVSPATTRDFRRVLAGSTSKRVVGGRKGGSLLHRTDGGEAHR